MRDQQYYLEHFQDILCEVESDDDAVNIMQAFETAITEMMTHHENQIKNYRSLHAKFLNADLKV